MLPLTAHSISFSPHPITNRPPSKLIGGEASGVTLAKAQRMFRCITLDKLTKEDMLNNQPDQSLFSKSQSAPLGGVDAFISHSWSDDPSCKYDKLQVWRGMFIDEHGREPRVWIDKVSFQMFIPLSCNTVGCADVSVVSNRLCCVESRVPCVKLMYEYSVWVMSFNTTHLRPKSAASTRTTFKTTLSASPSFSLDVTACWYWRERRTMISL